jgi:hypothetical protein
MLDAPIFKDGGKRRGSKHMVDSQIRDELVKQLDQLPAGPQRRVLEFARSLSGKPGGRRGALFGKIFRLANLCRSFLRGRSGKAFRGAATNSWRAAMPSESLS